MSLTRKMLADAIDGYDAEIAALQESKRETFQGYREDLSAVMGKDAVKAEIEGVKAAIKRRQAVVKKGETAVEERDALVEEIFAEITASRAPRATRENIEEFGVESALCSGREEASRLAHNQEIAGSSPAPATNSPETATQSTDASQERAQTATGVGTGGDNLAPASRPSASAKTGIPDHQSQVPGEGQSQHDSGVRVASVDTTSAARLKTIDEVADDMGLPAEAHPGCRKPKICGRFSHKGLCAICRGEDREVA